MSVSAVTEATVVPFGRMEYQFPYGRWSAIVSVIGDASAGTAICLVSLSASEQHRFFSIEEFSADNAIADTFFATILTKAITGGLEGTIGRLADSTVLFSGKQRAYWAGFRHIAELLTIESPSAQNILQLTGSNPGAGNTMSLRATGYVWHRLAQQYPGGPQRYISGSRQELDTTLIAPGGGGF